MPPAVLDKLLPEHVSPLVAYLCSEGVEETAQTYAVGGGYVARVAVVESAGVTLAGFIDIDAKKTGHSISGRPVIAPAMIPPANACFVVGGVGTRGARELIREALCGRGFVEGRDFLMAA